MDSHTYSHTAHPAHGYTNPQDPLTVGSHSGEEEHQEKTSVLKKVKAKAKKIKETITGHGHHHDDNNRDQDGYEDEEEDDVDEYEEIVQDPEIHGAPMYESAAARNFARSEDVNIEKPRNLGKDEDVDIKEPKVSFDERMHLEEEPHAPKDPFHQTVPGNYQTKVTDPTGVSREEAGMGPMVHAFGKMEMQEEPEVRFPPSSGGHDQFSSDLPSRFPPSSGSHDQLSSDLPSVLAEHNAKSVNISPKIQSVPESSNEGDQTNQSTNVGWKQPHQSSYTEKITSATSVIADKAKSATNVVAAKLGYRRTDMGEGNRGGEQTKGVTSIADTAISAKNAVAYKLGYGGNEDNVARERQRGGEQGKGVASTIAGTAMSAKNAVASKLGYGGSEGTRTTVEGEQGKTGGVTDSRVTVEGEQGETGGVTGSKTTAVEGEQGRTGEVTGSKTTAVEGEQGRTGELTEYGRQVASKVGEKLAPVYGAVAGAGSAVVSKVHGTTGSRTDTETNRNVDTGPVSGTNTGVEIGADRGVSMKGYLGEKLKPSEEDKALADIISDAFHKRKDEVHEEVDRPMGKVTESPEVARRLGTGSDERVTSDENPGQTYVDRFKGAVTSWFGKGGEMNPSQAIHDESSTSHGKLS